MFTGTKAIDSFLRGTDGDWFRLSRVEAFEVCDGRDGQAYVNAKMRSGDFYRVGPAGFATKDEARKWLDKYIGEICKGQIGEVYRGAV